MAQYFVCRFRGGVFVVGLFLVLIVSNKQPVGKYVGHKQETTSYNPSACNDYSTEIGADTKSLVDKQNEINQQLNDIGQKLSASQPLDTTSDILTLAKNYDPSKVDTITNLDREYNSLNDQITSIKQKYGCYQ